MKSRPLGFIDSSKIDHDGEIFDYIHELHEYLWRVVRAMSPSASGNLRDFLDDAIEDLEWRRGELRMSPLNKSLVGGREMSEDSSTVLAKAVTLLGKRVVVHWLDDEGSPCGVIGTLKRIDPKRKPIGGFKEYPKSLLIEEAYAQPAVERMTHIQAA